MRGEHSAWASSGVYCRLGDGLRPDPMIRQDASLTVALRTGRSYRQSKADLAVPAPASPLSCSQAPPTQGGQATVLCYCAPQNIALASRCPHGAGQMLHAGLQTQCTAVHAPATCMRPCACDSGHSCRQAAAHLADRTCMKVQLPCSVCSRVAARIQYRRRHEEMCQRGGLARS